MTRSVEGGAAGDDVDGDEQEGAAQHVLGMLAFGGGAVAEGVVEDVDGRYALDGVAAFAIGAASAVEVYSFRVIIEPDLVISS